MKKSIPAFVALMFAFGLGAAPAHAQHNVSLVWTASTSAAGNPSLTYNVYRSPGCSGTFALLNTMPISATSFLDLAVPPGTYCYQPVLVHLRPCRDRAFRSFRALALPPRSKR
jgi:hypothetical protein